MELKLGWLSPSGDFYECEEYDHIWKAKQLIKTYGYNYNEKSEWADDVIMSHGWVHITMSMLTGELMIFWDKGLTSNQRDFLRPYFEQTYRNVSGMSRVDWEEELRNESVI